MLTGILIGLSFAVLYGLQLVAFKKTLEQIAPSVCFFFYTLSGLLIWLPYAFWRGVDFSNIGSVLLVTFVSALLSEAYPNYSLSRGSISIASALFSTFSAATVVFAYLLLGERLRPATLAAVAAVICGIVVVSLPRRKGRFNISRLADVLFPLSAAAAVGFSDVISKGILNQTNVPTFLFGLALAQVPAAIVYHRVDRGHYAPLRGFRFDVRSHWPLLFAACANSLLLILFWMTYDSLYASIAGPVTATYALFVALFAWLFLGERLVPKDYIGIGLIVVSMVYLGLLG